MMKTKKPKLNVRLLRRIQKHILAEPRRLNMGDWNTLQRDKRNRVETSPDLLPPCGTVGCIAGWACHLEGKKPKTPRGFARTGAKLLGVQGFINGRWDYIIDDSPADKLFIVDSWPDNFRDRYQNANHNLFGTDRLNELAQITSDRIDHFISFGNDMQTSYFTFGQSHVHSVNGFTYDKDIVVKITAENPRNRMFELFGPKWAFQYDDGPPPMSYFPRGIKEVA